MLPALLRLILCQECQEFKMLRGSNLKTLIIMWLPPAEFSFFMLLDNCIMRVSLVLKPVSEKISRSKVKPPWFRWYSIMALQHPKWKMIRLILWDYSYWYLLPALHKNRSPSYIAETPLLELQKGCNEQFWHMLYLVPRHYHPIVAFHWQARQAHTRRHTNALVDSYQKAQRQWANIKKLGA